MNKMQTLGSGIEIVNYKTKKLRINDDEYEEITDDDWSYAEEESDILRKVRGSFISGCSEIDNALGEAISWFFFRDNTDNDKRTQFHDFILDTPIFSFIQRKKVLQLIMEKYPKDFPAFTGKQRQEMFDKINNLIKLRNAFAHGTFVINCNERKDSLVYYNSLKNQREDLVIDKDHTDQWDDEISDLALEILGCIPEEQ